MRKGSIKIFLVPLLSVILLIGCNSNYGNNEIIQEVNDGNESVEGISTNNNDIEYQNITNMVNVPISSEECKGKNYKEIEQIFEEAGFKTVIVDEYELEDNESNYSEGDVLKVYVGENDLFNQGDSIDPMTKIEIDYAVIVEVNEANDNYFKEESSEKIQDTDSYENAEELAEEREKNPEVTTNNSEDNISPEITVPEQADTEGDLVWVPKNGGTKYHSKQSCSGMKDPIQVTKEHAEENGYTPCKRCY